jgi:integrase
MTFRKACGEYIESMRAGWKNTKHADQWTNSLETYASPVMGDLQVRDIDLPHVIAVLQPIWRTKTETASRVRSRMEGVLGWARVHGYRTGDNPARWKDNLDKVFPAPRSVTPVEHVAALPVDDVPDFMEDLRARSGVRARALEFAVLTALRVGRVVAARWSEIDLDAKVWTIPAELMKGRKGQGREHRVPLSEPAIRILKEQSNLHAEWVFPGMKGDKPVTDAALSGLLAELDYKDKKGTVVDTHGFRSTFRDWASERTDYPREVAEMALAHAIGDKVEAAYRRGDLFDKRRNLMTDWAAYCDTAATR